MFIFKILEMLIRWSNDGLKFLLMYFQQTFLAVELLVKLFAPRFSCLLNGIDICIGLLFHRFKIGCRRIFWVEQLDTKPVEHC